MKLKHLLAVALMAIGGSAWAQSYTEGVEVAAGTDYFLMNVETGKFLTDGMDWGTHATVDNAGRVITFELNDGKYAIKTKTYVNNDKVGYMTDNGYLDSGSAQYWQFEPTTVDGYTNAYIIKQADDKVLYLNTADCRVNAGAASGNAATWIIVPLSVRQAANDYSYLLQNTDFNRPWERFNWSGTAPTAQAGGLGTNRVSEMYNMNFDMYQTVSNVPVGKWTLTCQGYYRAGAKDNTAIGTKNAKLYINNTEGDIMNILEGATAENTTGWDYRNPTYGFIPDNLNETSTHFLNGDFTNNTVTAVITNGASLQIGVKKTTTITNDWTAFDNFKLSYLGTCLVNDAVALPANGVMEADKWYFVTIGTDGTYSVTSDNISNIVVTTDAEQLTKEATGTSPWTAGDNDLTAGKYYVKSSSENTLTVAAKSFSYIVGSATVDLEYVQPGQKVTVTYADAATNDSEVSFAKQGTPTITFAEQTIEVTTTANGFTFVVPEVAANSALTLSIPAGAFGYAEHETNAQQDITINTPAVYDGTFYVRADDKYISRGNNYGTRAILASTGIALEVKTSAKNITTFKFTDTGKYLFDAGNDGTIYTDNNSNINWTIVAVAGGYNIINKNDRGHEGHPIVTKDSGNENPNLMSADEAGTIFVFETVSQYLTQMAKNTKDVPVGTEISYVINNPNISGNTDGWTISTKEGNGPITPGKDAFEIWKASTADENFDYNQTITGLPAGKYILSAEMKTPNNANGHTEGDAANGNAGLYAQAGSNAEVFQGVWDTGANMRRYGLLVTVAEGEDLKIGVKNIGTMGDNWFVADNFTLTKAGTETADIMDCNYVLKAGEKYLALRQAGAEDSEASLGADHSTELVLSAKTVDGITTLKNADKYFFVSSSVSSATSQVYADSENKGNKLNINWLAIPVGNDGKFALLNIGMGKMLVNNDGKINAESVDVTSDKLAVFEPEAVASMAVKAAAKYGTFVAPFEVAVPAGVTASTATLDGDVVTLTTVGATIPANTPVVLYAESGKDAEKFYGEVVVGTPEADALTGVYVETPAPVGSYVLQMHEGVAGFYQVESVQPTVGANRAYLTTESDARVLTFGEETAIKAIDALTTGKAEIFDLSGRKLNSLQKGINVVNGVKVLVK